MHKIAIVAAAALFAVSGSAFGWYNTTQTADGGAGGAGGSVGNVGNHSGNVDNSGNSRNTNKNRNTNKQGQLQGQLQGQHQGQGQGQHQGVYDSGNSHQGQIGINKAVGTGNKTRVSNPQTVTVEGDLYEAADIPVATAYAPALTSSNDTCMGSSSGGVQGMTFGVSFGSTWRDGDCVRRKDARLLHNMGYGSVAAALMCQKGEVAQAFADAGLTCGVAASKEEHAATGESTIHGEADVGTMSGGTVQSYRLPPILDNDN